MSKSENLKLKSRFGGLELDVLLYEPDSPVGIVQLAHGMAEHKERYIPFMEYLCFHGYVCIINDHRGHGGSVASQEDLGWFGENGAEAMVDDMLTVCHYIKDKYPALPFFLFGHSMGSLAVRAFTKRYDAELDGLVISGSPSANPAAGVARALCSVIGAFRGQRHRSKFINSLAFGAYGKKFTDTDNEFRWLSVDRDNVTAYEASPLCGYCFTVNGFKALFDCLIDVYSKKGWKVERPGLPVHFVAGEDDPCIVSPTDFGRAIDFLKARGYTDVTAHLYPGARHEILNDVCREQVKADLLAKLDGWRAAKA